MKGSKDKKWSRVGGRWKNRYRRKGKEGRREEGITSERRLEVRQRKEENGTKMGEEVLEESKWRQGREKKGN